MLSSPRRPSRTMRILSSAEKCRRVARRMSFTTCSAGALAGPDFSLIFAPSKGYDEPEILPSSTHPFCLTIADAGHFLKLPAPVSYGGGYECVDSVRQLGLYSFVLQSLGNSPTSKIAKHL